MWCLKSPSIFSPPPDGSLSYASFLTYWKMLINVMGLCTSHSSLAIVNYFHPWFQKNEGKGKESFCEFSAQSSKTEFNLKVIKVMCSPGWICKDNLSSHSYDYSGESVTLWHIKTLLCLNITTEEVCNTWRKLSIRIPIYLDSSWHQRMPTILMTTLSCDLIFKSPKKDLNI